MARDQSKQYNGKLTAQQTAEGMRRAVENAKLLVDEAKLLFENKRFPRAASLAILAIEEIGKLNILREILLESGQDWLTRGWKNYRSHTMKNKHWFFEELQARGAETFDEFAILDEPDGNHTIALDTFKQLGFYTDIDPSGKWISPNEAVTEKAAGYMIRKADKTANRHHTFSTEKELDLLVKYYKPVFGKGTKEEHHKALIKCYEEAEKQGYVEQGKAKRLADFLDAQMDE